MIFHSAQFANVEKVVSWQVFNVRITASETLTHKLFSYAQQESSNLGNPIRLQIVSYQTGMFL